MLTLCALQMLVLLLLLLLTSMWSPPRVSEMPPVGSFCRLFLVPIQISPVLSLFSFRRLAHMAEASICRQHSDWKVADGSVGRCGGVRLRGVGGLPGESRNRTTREIEKLQKNNQPNNKTDYISSPFRPQLEIFPLFLSCAADLLASTVMF